MPSCPSGKGSRKQDTAIGSEEGKVTGNIPLWKHNTGAKLSIWATFCAQRVKFRAYNVLNLYLSLSTLKILLMGLCR